MTMMVVMMMMMMGRDYEISCPHHHDLLADSLLAFRVNGLKMDFVPALVPSDYQASVLGRTETEAGSLQSDNFVPKYAVYNFPDVDNSSVQ